MPSTVTISAKIGAGVTVTTKILTGVTSFAIDCNNEVLSVNQSGEITDFDIAACATHTLTVSGNVYTYTVL
jgi:hypothetical protein